MINPAGNPARNNIAVWGKKNMPNLAASPVDGAGAAAENVAQEA